MTLLEKETSRTQKITAIKKAEEIFSGYLKDLNDALYTSGKKDHILVFSGLPYYAPVCAHILSDPLLSKKLGIGDKDILLIKEKDIRAYTGQEEIVLDSEVKERIQEILDRVLASPGYLDEEGNWHADLLAYPVGTHYGVNLLLGDRSAYKDCLQSTPKSVLDTLGRGSSRGKQEKQILSTRYVLSPEENGEPSNRQFYLTEDGRQIFCSFDLTDNVEKAECVHKRNRSVITYETKCGLRIERTIFLLPQEEGMPDAVEAQRVRIKNLTDHIRDLRIVTTGMFGISDPGTIAGDIVYANVVVESEVITKDGEPLALSAHHQPKECDREKRFAILLCNGEGMDEYSSSLYEFIGSGTLERPEMVCRLSNAHSRRQAAFFAMAKSFSLDKEAVIDIFTGMDSGQEDVRERFYEELSHLYERYRDPDELTKTLQDMIASNECYNSFLQMHSGDQNYDSYISSNLPFQVLYQTYVSRSFAWTQKSYRETGFREIQDIYASMAYMHGSGQDELIRRLITSWAENVFAFGYAYHNFTTRGKEPGMCSDDALWLADAVYRYVTMSGDYGLLFEEMKVAGSDERRPLYKTLESVLRYSGKISVGKHGLPLLDKADWNDTLRLDKNVPEGPEKEELYYQQLKDNDQEFGVPWENELSESVMNACLLKIAADEIRKMAETAGLEELASFAKEISLEVCDSTRKNAYINGYYARCLINDDRGYTYLGSNGDGLSLDPNIDGTYYLNSFSWPLLADIADESQIGEMLEKVEKYLKCDAGLKLVTPVDYDKLGIVTGSSFYFPGDRENGGVFKHAAMMATVACLKKAKSVRDEKLAKRLADLAFFMIDKTLPYKTLEDPFILKGNPRFCTQYNNSATGENIGPILSGTASWLTLAVYEICGFTLQKDRIMIDPVVDTESYDYTLNIRDTKIDVHIDASRSFRKSEKTLYRFDGEKCGEEIALPDDGKHHILEVKL